METNESKFTLEIFHEYSSRRLSWIQLSQKSRDFAIGKQWELEDYQDLKDRRHFPIVVNVVYPAMQQSVAMLTTNKPKFASTARDDSDGQTGRVFADLMSYIWDYNNGNAELKMQIEDACITGQGYIMPYFDQNKDMGKGEICFKSVPPEEVYPDPNSRDKFFRDAAHILIAKEITYEQACSTYPQLKEYDKNIFQQDYEKVAISRGNRVGMEEDPSLSAYMDTYHRKYSLIDRYSKKKIPLYKVFEQSNQEEKTFVGEEDFAAYSEEPAVAVLNEGQGTPSYYLKENEVSYFMGLFEQTGGVFFTAQLPDGSSQMVAGTPETADPQIAQFYVQGSLTQIQPLNKMQLIDAGIIQVTQILEDRIFRNLVFGGVSLFEGYMPNLEDYPIARLVFRDNRTPYPEGDVPLVMGIQQWINKTRSLLLSHATNNTNIKVIVNRGSIANKEQFEEWLSSAGTKVLEIDMSEPYNVPIIVQPAPLPNELYKSEADARRDIQEIFGLYSMMGGDSTNAPEAYRGIVALDEFGQRRIKSRKDDVEEMLNYFGRIIVSFIQTYYTEYKVIRIVRPNNSDVNVEINKPIYSDPTKSFAGKINDVTTGKYDVIVVSGSMLPSNRWAMLEYYQGLYRDGIIDQQEVLAKTEVADKEGVIERFGQISRLQAQLEEAMNRIGKLEGDMQTMERENVHLKQSAEMAKFKADLSIITNKATASKQIMDNRMKDEQNNNKAKVKLFLDSVQAEADNIIEKEKLNLKNKQKGQK